MQGLIMLNKENGLIATAMLRYFFELKGSKDSIDLLMPFVKQAIFITCNLNDEINIEKLSNKLCEEFGFETFPNAVVKKFLGRIKNSGYVVLKDKKFFYIKSLESEYKLFLARKDQFTSEFDKVLSEVKIVIDNKHGKLNNETEYKEKFVSFLDKFGSNIIKQELAPKGDFFDFTIASFIIEQQEKSSLLFEYIVNIIKGILISRALYLQIDNASFYDANFKKGTEIYFDTTFILRALGLKKSSENKEARDLIKLIPSSVKLKCFYHTFDEVKGVLNKYKKRRFNSFNSDTRITLEHFDEIKITEGSLDVYIDTLEKRLKEIGIDIDYTDMVEFGYECQNQRGEHLEEYFELKYNERQKFYSSERTPEQLQDSRRKDILSILAIKRIRNNYATKQIESCKAIFVTLNSWLVELTKEFFQIPFEDLNYLITANDIQILLWIKRYRSFVDFPREKLIAFANAAIDVSSTEFISEILQYAENLKNEGVIDETDLTLIATNNYLQRELIESSGCNPTRVSKELLFDKSEQLKKAIIDEAVKDKDEIIRELQKQVVANEVDKKNTAVNDAKKKAQLLTKIIKISLFSVVALLTIVSVIWACLNFDYNKSFIFLCSILLIDLMSAVDFFITKVIKNKLSKLENFFNHRFLLKICKERNITVD